MKKYEIWFCDGLPYSCYPDKALNTSEFINSYVTGVFATDDTNLFWSLYVPIILNRPCKWYYVMLNGEQILCGASEPDDINYISKYIKVPDWVFDEFPEL